MKFCPYCGAELVNSEAQFCSECGTPLAAAMPEDAQRKPADSPAKRRPIWKKSKAKKEKRRLHTITADAISAEGENDLSSQDDGYDGYYDDVLPSDEGSHQDGLNKELVKNVAALIIGVLVIVAASVAFMYLL